MNRSLLGRVGELAYKQMVRSCNSPTLRGRLSYRLSGLLRSAILRVADPCVRMDARGAPLFMPLSHDMPLHVAQTPTYDGLLERVATFLRSRRGELTVVDVGANIGDTIRFCCRGDDTSGSFLGIEGNSVYMAYLVENLAGFEHAKALNVLCSSFDGEAAWSTVREAGTARIVEGGDCRASAKSLDTIVDENPEFAGFNFLKVDTDGHDFEVIQGARRHIAENMPAILFECAPFDNSDFASDFVDAVELLRGCGYRSALVYDNFGYLFGAFALDDPSTFKDSLLYLLTSRFYYFDILVLDEPDMAGFKPAEVAFFVDQAPSAARRAAAAAIADLWDRGAASAVSAARGSMIASREPS